MNTSRIKQAAFFIVITVITIGLLEVSSGLILYFKSSKLAAVQDEFVFQQINSDGSFAPTKEYVLPIRKNARFEWISPNFNIEVRTNNLGLREDFEIELKDIEVAFFGDSFTFGHGVNVEDRYTNIFAANFQAIPKNKIASLSYLNGFQPEHYEYYFRNNSDLKPKHVIAGVYLGNDFGSDVLETIYDPETNKLLLPYRRIFEDGQIGMTANSYKFPLDLLADHSYFIELFLKIVGRTQYRSNLFKQGFQEPNAVNAIDLERGKQNLILNRATQALLRLNQYVKERGGNLTILIIPQNYFFTDKNPHIHPYFFSRLSEIRGEDNILKAFKEVCRIRNLNCYDPTPILQESDYFPHDAHWNKAGNHKIGKALADHLSLQ